MPYFGSAIGGLAEGFGQGLTYAERLRMMQQQQQERELVSQAQERAGNLLAQQYAPPPVQRQAPTPMPQTVGPPPGVSPTPAPMGGQAPTQPPGAPMPRTAPMGAQPAAPMPQGLPPYQPMPTGVSQQPPQEAITPPPEKKSVFERTAESLVSQGLTGKPLLYALHELVPYMGQEYKQQLDQANQMIKMYDIALKGRREERLGEHQTVQEQQQQQKIDLMKERLEYYKKSVSQGASEALTPGGIKVAEELVAAGKPLPGGWGMKGMSRGNAILNALAKEEEGGAGSGAVVAGQAEFKAGEKSLSQLTVRANAIEQSSKKIDKDVKTLLKYLDSGTAGSVRLINEPVNKIREKFSSPELGELMVAAQIVGTEYERMINGGLLSVAQLHEGAREDARRLINGDMTPTEMRARLKVMLQEIENQKSAFKEQISEVKTGMKKGVSRQPKSSSDMKTAAEDAWGKYEPEKYDYRIMDGNIQRRSKSGK